MKLNIRQLIERLSLNIDDIILEVFKKDIIVFNSFWDDTDIEKYLKKKVKYFIAHYDSKDYGDKYVLTVDI